jgi:hypothetical protein
VRKRNVVTERKWKWVVGKYDKVADDGDSGKTYTYTFEKGYRKRRGIKERTLISFVHHII